MIRQIFIVILFIGTILPHFLVAQTIPMAPNVRNADGKRVGEWVILKDKNFQEITNIRDAEFYRMIKYDTIGIPLDTVKGYYKSGQMQWKGVLLHAEPDIFDGEITQFSEEGYITSTKYFSGIPILLYNYDVSFLIESGLNKLLFAERVASLSETSELFNIFYQELYTKLTKSINNYESNNLKHSPSYFKLKLALANVFKKTDKMNKSIEVLVEIASGTSIVSDKKLYVDIFLNLADVYKLNGDFQKSEAIYLEILNKIGERDLQYEYIETKYNNLQYIRRNYLSGLFQSTIKGDSLHEEIYKKYKGDITSLRFELLKHPLPSVRNDALNLIINSKNQSLKRKLTFKEYLYKNFPEKINLLERKNILEHTLINKESKDIFKQLKDINTILTPYYLIYSTNNANDEFFEKIDNNEKKNHLKVFKNLYESIDNQTAILEIIYNQDRLGQNSCQYYAAIFKKDEPNPIILNLFDEADLNQFKSNHSIQPDTLRGVGLPRASSYKVDEKIYELFWSKLEPYFTNVKTILYSPVGTLMSLNIGALYKYQDTSRIYLDEKYDFIQKLSIKDVSNEFRFNPKEVCLAFGDIEYGDKNDYPFKNLSNTKKEIDIVENVFQNTISFNAKNASELNLINNLKLFPSVIHFASHAYYYSYDSAKKITNNLTKIPTFKNPLDRTGLLMAGCNDYLLSKNISDENGLDGVLTSSEISVLDMSRTKLVVLSACDTGLGDIVGDEGIFGLQRAFKLAGVKQILMSLWIVGDAPTAEYMKLFYENWAKGLDTREAYRRTQKAMRKLYPTKPENWAAFVLVD